jgi:hypothetical protein
MAIEDLTTELIERWSAQLTAGGRMCNRTKLKILTVLHGVTKRAVRVWKLPGNPVAGVEKPLQRHRGHRRHTSGRAELPVAALLPATRPSCCDGTPLRLADTRRGRRRQERPSSASTGRCMSRSRYRWHPSP